MRYVMLLDRTVTCYLSDLVLVLRHLGFKCQWPDSTEDNTIINSRSINISCFICLHDLLWQLAAKYHSSSVG